MKDNFIVNLFVKPVIRRLGTALATFLATRGVPEDEVAAITTGLAMAAAVLTDLFLSYKNKQEA